MPCFNCLNCGRKNRLLTDERTATLSTQTSRFLQSVFPWTRNETQTQLRYKRSHSVSLKADIEDLTNALAPSQNENPMDTKRVFPETLPMGTAEDDLTSHITSNVSASMPTTAFNVSVARLIQTYEEQAAKSPEHVLLRQSIPHTTTHTGNSLSQLMQAETKLPELLLPKDNPRSLYSRRLHRTSKSNSRCRTWKERFCCWCTPCKQRHPPPSSVDKTREPGLPAVEQSIQPGPTEDSPDVITKLRDIENKYANRDKYCSMFGDAPLYQLYFDMMSQDKNQAGSQPLKSETPEAKLFPGKDSSGLNKLQFHNENQIEPIDEDSPDHKSSSQNSYSSTSKGLGHFHSGRSTSPVRLPTVRDTRRRPTSDSARSSTSPIGKGSQREMKDFVAEVAGVGPNRAFWCVMPEVVSLGLAKGMSSTQKKLQEALFEVLTSEASYYRSINVLIDHFYNAPTFQPGLPCGVLTFQEKHHLFSNIHEIRATSENLLIDLEACYRSNLMMSNLCEVVYRHSEYNLQPYVTYVQNQMYQTRTLLLLNSRPDFKSAVMAIQSQPEIAFLDMNSFLLMPMQRVTRLRLLVATLLRYAPKATKVYNSGLVALASLEQFISKCDRQKSIMEQKERLMDLFSRLEYRLNAKSVGSENRVVKKEGDLRLASVSRPMESVFRQPLVSMRRSKQMAATLFLFDDLLLIVKKRSNKRIMVEDSTALPQIDVQVGRTPPDVTITNYLPAPHNSDKLIDRTPSCRKPPHRRSSAPNRRRPSSGLSIQAETAEFPFSFKLTINNSEDTCSFYTFLCKTLSERERWMDALSPTHYGLPDECFLNIIDCPKMIIRRSYSALEGDELELKEGDQVSLLVSLSDGWSKGILPDGHRGWFPTNIGEEVLDPSQIRECSENFLLVEDARRKYVMRKRMEHLQDFPTVSEVKKKWFADPKFTNQ